MGKDIRRIEDIDAEEADEVIIASSPKNVTDIFWRLVFLCIKRGWGLFDVSFNSLFAEYFKRSNIQDYKSAKYLRKNENELKKTISKYDVVSFDLFDTLVTRKVMSPDDVFDALDVKFEKKGLIKSFAYKRTLAGEKANGANINEIYSIMGKEFNIDNETLARVLKEELEFEEQCIIPRNQMVNILNWACSEGKEVFVVSDMYLSADYLDDLLRRKGIVGYKQILVSCDYEGISKKDGLFKILQEKIDGKKCIHIGDSRTSDIEPAESEGIDTYEIYSPLDLMRISNIRGLIGKASTVGERMLVGYIASYIFNDPFSLFSMSGIVSIKSISEFTVAVCLPIVVVYFSYLIEYMGRYDLEGIIFAARDGYVFFEIYKRIRMRDKEQYYLKPFYIYASRKLNVKNMVNTKDDIVKVEKYTIQNNPALTLELLYGIELSDDLKNRELSWQEIEDCYGDEIVEISTRSTSNYKAYLSKEGIYADKSYCLFDLVAQGTTQKSLSELGYKKVVGLYWERVHGNHIYNLPIEAVFDSLDDMGKSAIEKSNLLEMIFTSPENSCVDIDDELKPVFSKERRNIEEQATIREIHQYLVEFAEEYLCFFYDGEVINKDLADMCISMINEFEYTRDAKILETIESNSDNYYVKWIDRQ